MRIGIDARSLEPPRAGIGRYLEQLLGALCRIGHGSEFVLWTTAWRSCASERLHGDASQHLRWVQGPFPDRALDWMVRKGTGMGFGAEHLLGPLDCFHHPSPLLVPLRATPRVITIHDLWFMRHPDSVPRQTFATLVNGLRNGVRRGAAIITDSEWVGSEVTELLGVARDRIRVIPLAPDRAFVHVPAQSVDAVVSQYGLRRGEYIIFVGTIEPRKNIQRLLCAFTAWSERRGRRVPRLVLAGRFGWMCQDVVETLKDPRLRDLVIPLGYVPQTDLPGLVRGALFCCFVSLHEGFGLPAVDAMACGTPVIASTAAALPEVLGDGALLVDPEDLTALTDALEQLTDDSALRDGLKRRGFLRVAQLSWERTARETYGFYQEVAGKRGMGSASSLPAF